MLYLKLENFGLYKGTGIVFSTHNKGAICLSQDFVSLTLAMWGPEVLCCAEPPCAGQVVEQCSQSVPRTCQWHHLSPYKLPPNASGTPFSPPKLPTNASGNPFLPSKLPQIKWYPNTLKGLLLKNISSEINIHMLKMCVILSKQWE